MLASRYLTLLGLLVEALNKEHHLSNATLRSARFPAPHPLGDLGAWSA